MKPGDLDKLGRRFAVKPRLCVICEKRFQPTSGFQKYCSPACRVEAEKEDFTCKECGAVFRRPRSNRPTFCSNTCANRSANKGRRGQKGRFGYGISLAKPKQIAVCEICKQKFEKQHRTARYCSKSCSNVGRARLRRETLGTPEPWSIRSKGEEACRNCQRFADHLHHVVPRSKSLAGKTDLRNGIPLCHECHMGWHHRRLTLHRDLLSAEEHAFAVELAGAWWVEKHYPDRPEAVVEAVSLAFLSGYRYALAVARGLTPEPDYHSEQLARTLRENKMTNDRSVADAA